MGLTLLGLAALAAVPVLLGLGRRKKPEPPAIRATREIKQAGARARTQINTASADYLKNVRDNARR